MQHDYMTTQGEAILCNTLSALRLSDSKGNNWQYNSRSDRHSKIACWAILFDLLLESDLLRRHVAARKVGYGINHEMRNFRSGMSKNLDLVLCRISDDPVASKDFATMGSEIGVVLDAAQNAKLSALPKVSEAAVSTVLVAVEAKACMTEHGKARSRLHDELSSSFQTIHGDTNSAIAGCFVMVNCSDEFISSGKNNRPAASRRYIVNKHRQPDAAMLTLEGLQRIRRRSSEKDDGFDALGISMVSCRNDGSPVTLDISMSAKVAGMLSYPDFIHRLAQLYSMRFSEI